MNEKSKQKINKPKCQNTYIINSYGDVNSQFNHMVQKKNKGQLWSLNLIGYPFDYSNKIIINQNNVSRNGWFQIENCAEYDCMNWKKTVHLVFLKKNEPFLNIDQNESPKIDHYNSNHSFR